MNLLGSLLPGLREVRGPLIAGYLWLLAGWLSFGDSLPDQNACEEYCPLFEVGDAIGTTGLFAVASVSAYLLGSLTHGFVELFFKTMGRVWLHVSSAIADRVPVLRRLLSPTDHELYEDDGRPLEALIGLTGRDDDLPTLRTGFSAERLRDSVAELAGRELGEVRRRLRVAVTREVESNGNTAATFKLRRGDGNEWLVSLDGSVEVFALPRFSPREDLLSRVSLLRTRLSEVAEGTGATIERLYGEAQFRFTIVLPMAAAIAAFAREAPSYWLALLVPLAMLVQAFGIRWDADCALIDVLRTRVETEELEGITSVFARHRILSDKLSDHLEKRRRARDGQPA